MYVLLVGGPWDGQERDFKPGVNAVDVAIPPEPEMIDDEIVVLAPVILGSYRRHWFFPNVMHWYPDPTPKPTDQHGRFTTQEVPRVDDEH